MSGVLEKIRKRRFYPVSLENGETIHLRSMGWEDRLARDELQDVKDRVVFGMGVCLVEEGESPAFTRGENESVAEFIARVRDASTELTYEDVKAINDAIAKVNKTPSVEVVAKNFEPTAAPAS